MASAAERPVRRGRESDRHTWGRQVLSNGVSVSRLIEGSASEPSLMTAAAQTKAAIGRDVFLVMSSVETRVWADYVLELQHQTDESATDAKGRSYPECGLSAKEGSCFCECSNLLSPHPANRLIASMSMDMVLKSSKSIRGIVMVIDDSVVYGPKTTWLRYLHAQLQLIGYLMRDTPEELAEIESSMTLIYINNGEYSKNISQLKSKFLQGAREGMEIMQLFSRLVSMGQGVVMNPEDAGESRTAIQLCFGNSITISKTLFAFHHMDSTQAEMRPVMRAIAEEANGLMIRMEEVPEQLSEQRFRLAELNFLAPSTEREAQKSRIARLIPVIEMKAHLAQIDFDRALPVYQWLQHMVIALGYAVEFQ